MQPKIRSLFAELYVAGVLTDAGWNVFFPKRDEGFDMIAVKKTADNIVLRPIQVKGLYPSSNKMPKSYYGYVGKLTQTHKEMALVIVYFDVAENVPSPSLMAWMPWSKVRKHSRGYKCQPAKFRDGRANMRRDYKGYFGADGLARMASLGWE